MDIVDNSAPDDRLWQMAVITNMTGFFVAIFFSLRYSGSAVPNLVYGSTGLSENSQGIRQLFAILRLKMPRNCQHHLTRGVREFSFFCKQKRLGSAILDYLKLP